MPDLQIHYTFLGESLTLLQHSWVPFCGNAIFLGAPIWKMPIILLFGPAAVEDSDVVGDLLSYHLAKLNGEKVLSMVVTQLPRRLRQRLEWNHD